MILFMKTRAIAIFSFFIFLIFSIIALFSIPWLFAHQHQAIAFLGIFLILFTIPIILYILIKKSMRLYTIIFYLIYFIITSITNVILSSIIQERIFYKFNHTFKFSRFFDPMMIFFLLIFFSFQLPIIILCILIKKTSIYNNKINLKYFFKNPLIYIFILSLVLFPLIFFIF
jgi:hypothetical protein